VKLLCGCEWDGRADDGLGVTDHRGLEAPAEERELGEVQFGGVGEEGDGADQQQHVEPQPAWRTRFWFFLFRRMLTRATQDPMVDFHKFFDGESLNQTDLVAWVNVGTHHLVRPTPSQQRPSPLTRDPPAPSRGLAEHAHEHRRLLLLPHAAQLLRRRRRDGVAQRDPALAPRRARRGLRVRRLRRRRRALRPAGGPAVRVRGHAGVRARREEDDGAEGRGGAQEGGGAVPSDQGRTVECEDVDSRSRHIDQAVFTVFAMYR
jgi:hypothetical protein